MLERESTISCGLAGKVRVCLTSAALANMQKTDNIFQIKNEIVCTVIVDIQDNAKQLLH